MLKFPRKEERKNERKEGEIKERNGKKIKGKILVVYWERRRACIKSNEGTWLGAGKKNNFWSPD